MKQDQDHDYLFKIFLLGKMGVGKSSLFLRFSDNLYTAKYEPSIGIDFKFKMFSFLGKTIKIHIWDSAGSIKFRDIVSACFADAHGALICFDLTDEDSFTQIEALTTQFRDKALPNPSMILIGCKSDRECERVIDYQLAEKKANELGMAYIEISSSNKINTENAFSELVKLLYIKASLDLIKPVLEQYFIDYLNIYSRDNMHRLFNEDKRPSNQEIEIQREHNDHLNELFATRNQQNLEEFYTKTLVLIEKANSLYKMMEPITGRIYTSALSKMLKRTLSDLDDIMPGLHKTRATPSISVS